MKRKNKGSYIKAVIVALFAAMLIIAVAPTTAFCAADDTLADVDGTTGGVGQDTADDNLADVDGTTGGVGQDTADDTLADADGTTGGVGQDTNVFTAIYEAAGEYAGEILSALAFIGSIIIMICYKSGLLPIVKEGLLALMSGVKSLGEHSGNIASYTEAMKDEIAKECLRTEELLRGMENALSTIEKKLGDEAARTSEIAAMKSALICEVNMISEVFMAAALPQYLKDKVGETARNMKATLGEGECDDGKK